VEIRNRQREEIGKQTEREQTGEREGNRQGNREGREGPVVKGF
jgi:hypothetical protein